MMQGSLRPAASLTFAFFLALKAVQLRLVQSPFLKVRGWVGQSPNVAVVIEPSFVHLDLVRIHPCLVFFCEVEV